MTDQEFDQVVEEVWGRLLKIVPDELKAHFDKFRILIENEPTAEVLDEINGTDLADYPEDLCGLYVGTPLPEQGISAQPLFADRVFLFRDALIDFADFDGTPEGDTRLREEVAITLLHEIGHFFGLDEDDLERLGFD